MIFNFFGRTFSFLGEENQIKKAVDMLEKYIFKPEIIILLVVLGVFLAFCIFAKLSKNEKLMKTILKISPWIYFCIVIWLTILNREGGEREIRLYFDSWFTERGFHESAVLGFGLNAALYVPFGYLLYMYSNLSKRWLYASGIIVFSSVAIEVLQYVLSRGITAADDVAANTLGGVIGVLIAMIFNKFKRESVK